MKITFELQLLKGSIIKNRDDGRYLVGTDGVPPLQGRHMTVCLGGL